MVAAAAVDIEFELPSMCACVRTVCLYTCTYVNIVVFNYIFNARDAVCF